jgi:hypothetical protein
LITNDFVRDDNRSGAAGNRYVNGTLPTNIDARKLLQGRKRANVQFDVEEFPFATCR